MSVQAAESFVEEISDVEHDEHVHGPNCSHDHEADHESDANAHSRNERKVRKELIKLGLKPLSGIHRITFKRGKMIFAISNPEVFKNPSSDSYIIFGEARVEDPGFQAQLAAAQRMAQQAAANASLNETSAASSASSNAAATEEDDEEVDASGLNESDIKIVMEQANVSRNKAINALREHNNDVVNTIMELSM